MTEHLTRQELFGAAQGKQAKHLASCPECAEMKELITDFSFAGRPMLASAPPNWLAKAMTISGLNSSRGIVARFKAAVSFDSWDTRLALGVRGEVQAERRLRFSHDRASADFRAEQTAEGWRFMARLSISDQPASESRLVVDGQPYFPDASGFVDWNGTEPPRELHIETSTYIIEIPALSWYYQK